MEITITMSEEDFQEFMAWKNDRSHYCTEMEAMREKWEYLAGKTCWAIGEDHKHPGKVKIVDQEHAAELLEMVHGLLA